MKTDTLASSRTIQIDGMSGDACVQKVTASLKNIPGVTTKSVTVGSAMIEADQAGCDSACAAINKAGFKAHLKTSEKKADGSNSIDASRAAADGKDHHGSGHSTQSNKNDANDGSVNKSVEPKSGNQSQSAKSH